MLDSLDWLFDTVALVFLFLILATLNVAFVWLGSLPGNIAGKRAHPQADAVSALGWLGLLFVILWPIALAWAFVRSPIAAAPPAKEGGP
jgi:hypothetical protein